jgi:colanic acid biosynthesis glycosyl transferase WcaI
MGQFIEDNSVEGDRRVNLLVMGMNYAPEKTGIGPFTAELCEHLAENGHSVFVATTFPHYPEWEIHDLYRGKRFLREERNGVDVCRGYTYLPGKPNAWQRILYDTSLAISTFLSGLMIGDVDVILAVGPPVQLGATAWLLSKIRGASFIFQLQDLAVDAAIAVGMLENPSLIRLAHFLEDFVYRKAEDILVICQGFAENLQDRGVPGSKIHVISNWVDTTFIRPMDGNNVFRHAHGLDDDLFVILHAGNMGAKQGLDNAILAAGQLGDHDDTIFLLIGDGSDKARLVGMAARESIFNVRFLPLQPRDVLPHMLSAADVLLLNQRADVVDMVIPSKLLTYMAAGRPIVAAVHPESEAAKYIRRAQCGLVVQPESPGELADAICQIRSDPERADRLGRSARVFAEENFARDRVLRWYEEFFSRVGIAGE